MNHLSEWLETDGLGGFAMGTSSGVRTRRYHGLFCPAVPPQLQRVMLVNGVDAWVNIGQESVALSTQHYYPDVFSPDGQKYLSEFTFRPWPKWVYKIGEHKIEFEVFMPKALPCVVLSWNVLTPSKNLSLTVRPFFSGRDYHSLHKKNSFFQFTPKTENGFHEWNLYDGVLPFLSFSNGTYIHQPDWYRQFSYAQERSRGLDSEEDLATPGYYKFDLLKKRAVLIFSTKEIEPYLINQKNPEKIYESLKSVEIKRRVGFKSPVFQSADDYLIRCENNTTIIAGYPWFTAWGRDTFISLRGLCLSTGRFEEAAKILMNWADHIRDGLMPNYIPERDKSAVYNSVDASLWFIMAVHDFFKKSKKEGYELYDVITKLKATVLEILQAYKKGTRHGIVLDTDGLLMCGEKGHQLTWMDAKLGEWVITPRIGKPVEIQALWLNSLWFAGSYSSEWTDLLKKGRESFEKKFFSHELGFLHDVIDVDHEVGKADSSLRPNQLFAVGGLPLVLVSPTQARQIVDLIEKKLWVPLGIRSLSPEDPHYVGKYEGGVIERDSSYHQGTAWPWLLGPFVEAWVRVRGSGKEVKIEARKNFLSPMITHFQEAGLGHISEIVDGDFPHTPRGCPFQAWSMSEFLRLDQEVLLEESNHLEHN
ncbi:MAG: amylo-alpha-1,6-glucosidase [Elusimicrobiota bacterium]